MKIVLSSFFFLIFVSVAMAQAPQGINYQGVAFGANGLPISKHIVGIRLSILDSIPAGKILYQESQTPTTDTTGLFSVVIGTGTVLQGNFLTINWGTNNKYLKTEIDTAGGTNYVVMGVTQFMSVPYALYANATKETYGSIQNPDGLNNLSTVIIDSNSYTVPPGKNLYVPGLTYIISNSDTLQAGAVPGYIWGSELASPLGFSEGQTVSTAYNNGPVASIYVNNPAWITDKTVDWVTQDIVANPITVPAGKAFVITYSGPNPNSFYYTYSTQQPYYTGPGIYINGRLINEYYPMNFNIIGWILSSGQTLSAQAINGTSGQFIVNGYFRKQ